MNQKTAQILVNIVLPFIYLIMVCYLGINILFLSLRIKDIARQCEESREIEIDGHIFWCVKTQKEEN